MTTQLKLRGGTTAEHTAFTGGDREVTVDTDKNTLVVHDGSTAGGFPLALASAGAIPSSLTVDDITITSWTVSESGGNLYFSVGGVNKMKLDTNGNLDVAGDVNTSATIT